MTTTAVDDQYAADRDAVIDEMARFVSPMEWRGGGHMRYAGHIITWGEYIQRRLELEAEFSVEAACMDCGALEGTPHHSNCATHERHAVLDKAADPGAHYRWELRRRITDGDIARGWVSVKVDPYRIARVAGIQGGPHEHATKKLLRGEAKGHEARQLIREVRCCLDRWEQMLDEDEQEATCRGQ